MNLVYGALLLHSAGKPVNEETMKKLADAVGEKIEEVQIKALVAALEGVNIDNAISKAAMPVATAAPAAPSAEAEKTEEVDEKEKEKKAEEAAEGLGALFG
ncbi:MAG: 50S ribosomal protein P1 [Candidatus Aenigmarchaeota archaeon]|nr:50S ribosomal protein P1 [Candidatus Aenigmarchaeota archaeon]